MKITHFYLLSVLLFSCGNKEPRGKQEIPHTKSKKEAFDTRARRHAESALNISPTEKYTLRIYKENLNGDDKMDAIITVNRLNYAKNEATKSANPAKIAEMGFMGNYNYFFYYDGELDKISTEFKIASSPNAELKVDFAHISSDYHKDILIDYRILNASYRDFYTVMEHMAYRVFMWKVFEGINAEKKEAYHFVYDKGTLCQNKDILVMKGKLSVPEKPVDPYKYQPTITPSTELIYRFFYYPKEKKYFTKK